jgi:parallel beta-helix repeat protein
MKKYPFKVSILTALSRGKVFSRAFAIVMCIIMIIFACKGERVKPKSEAQKIEELIFEVKEFPDGLVERRYKFVLPPEKATPPYNVTLVSGALPPGLTLDQHTGSIDGEPSQAGEYELAIRVADAQGKMGTFSGSVKVWRPLLVGEHGTFKGVDGLQMALNVVQDMDDIRIERGTYKGSGFEIPESKSWSHWIKISGGWNETFEERSSNPEDTILDGGGKESRILTIRGGKVSLENFTFRNGKGEAVFGAASFANCAFTRSGAVAGGGTFTNCAFTSSGKIHWGGTFTNCTFTSSAGVSVSKGNSGTFTNCTFTSSAGVSVTASSGNFTGCTFTSSYVSVEGYDGNSSSGTFTNCTFTGNKGGARVGGDGSSGTFTNCTFTDNPDGAVSVDTGYGTFTNCTFTGNSGYYGVVQMRGGKTKYGKPFYTNCTFTNCTFTNNSTSSGAVDMYKGYGTFTNCTFTNNSASNVGGGGGAVSVASWGESSHGTFTNCTFTNNSARDGAVYVSHSECSGSFVNCLFYKNSASSGGAISGDKEGKVIVINCSFYGNSAKEEGGAIVGGGSIINSIFYKNTAGGKDNDITPTGSMEIDYCLINYLKGAVNLGPHNIMVNPKFVDPEQGDFHLRPDSPCVNAGNEVPEAFKERPLDLDGKPRVVGGKIDMGAYEWQGE